jgi:hypothetical protein
VDGPPVRPQQTVKDVNQGGFAGTVFADQRMNFSLPHGEVNFIVGQHQGKFLGDLTHVDGKICHGAGSSD